MASLSAFSTFPIRSRTWTSLLMVAGLPTCLAGRCTCRSIPSPGEPIPISVGGGTNPAWSRNRSELYYLRSAKENPQRLQMMVVDVDDRKGFSAREPPCLVRGPLWIDSPAALVRRRARRPVHHDATGRRSRAAVHAAGGRPQLCGGAAPAGARAALSASVRGKPETRRRAVILSRRPIAGRAIRGPAAARCRRRGRRRGSCDSGTSAPACAALRRAAAGS